MEDIFRKKLVKLNLEKVYIPTLHKMASEDLKLKHFNPQRLQTV